MNKFANNLNNIINHRSRDTNFGESLEYFLSFLDSLKVNYIVVGSCAIQSYFDYMNRVPNDIDIVLPECQIIKIKASCVNEPDLKFKEHPVANKLYYKNYCHLHLIPENMKLVDKINQTVFSKVNIFFEDRTVQNEISLLNYKEKIHIRVPILEYIYCMNLFTQLDTNIVNDSIHILENYKLNIELVYEFVSRCKIMKGILENRSKKLKNILGVYRPDLIKKVILIK